MVKVRVLAAHYGSHIGGEVIEIPEKEAARVGKTVLVPISEESSDPDSPPPAPDPDAAARKNQQAAWRDLGKKSEAISKRNEAIAADAKAKELSKYLPGAASVDEGDPSSSSSKKPKK